MLAIGWPMPLGTAVVLFHALACNIFRFLK
ncbi:hypothetical protein ACUXG4_006148 [Cupriavidus metallidurans]